MIKCASTLFIDSISSKIVNNQTTKSKILTTTPNILSNNLNNENKSISIASSLIYSNPSSAEINKLKVNIIKENLFEKISDIIDEIEVEKIYEKNNDDFSIYIYPTNSTHFPSSIHVNFSECEKILRNHYKIPDSSIMSFLQIELNNDVSNSLINQVEYQAYDGKKTLLDLSLCDDEILMLFILLKIIH